MTPGCRTPMLPARPYALLDNREARRPAGPSCGRNTGAGVAARTARSGVADERVLPLPRGGTLRCGALGGLGRSTRP
ncbi:MAG: hypothetical protein J2P50_10420, partial [Hyphomicrobiaceae bacterium]|nr:hypothetical protein [Hyphomicrobiaceae bacterium]